MSQTEKHSVTEKKIFIKEKGHLFTISVALSNSKFNDCINMNFMLFSKVLNFSKILGFDMWYQSMVQTLGLDVAESLSV